MKSIFAKIRLLTAGVLAVAALAPGARAEEIDYEAALTGTVGSGRFAPFYTASLRHGTLTARDNMLLSVRASHAMDTTRRLSWDYGVEAFAGLSSSTLYGRFEAPTADNPAGEWVNNRRRPAYAWLQQLYGSLKWRSLFVELGMREQHSPLLRQSLTGGDLIQSGNSRPLPGGRAGFIDFQDIPFTNGWVQIEGQLFYGRYTDSDWWAERYNRYNGHVARGQWMVYRRCYFRTKPEQPLSVTVGVQCASQFGGTTDYYKHGVWQYAQKHPARLKDFVKMFWPVEDGTEGFIQGNTIGSWDFKARYRLDDGSRVKFYFQWPWEDGSGMGKLNGFDGLWGVEYDFSVHSRFVKAVVVEYLDLTNQSGPMHWDPDDRPGTTIGYRAEGADDYYNNFFYNSYAAYGMAQGTPMVMSPLYNRDGYMQFVGNRMRGIHVALEGSLSPTVDYRMKLGHRRAWGNGKMQLAEPIQLTSFMFEAAYSAPALKGFSFKGTMAIDGGTMPCGAFGVLLGVAYNGFLNL